MHQFNRFQQEFTDRLRPLVNRKLALCVLLLSAVTTVYAVLFAHSVPGPIPLLDSVTDAGNGKFTISWSLADKVAGIEYRYDHPNQACVQFAEPEAFQTGEVMEKCFSEGMSTQADLTVDSGIGGGTTPTVYSVQIIADYYGEEITNAQQSKKNVTLNASN